MSIICFILQSFVYILVFSFRHIYTINLFLIWLIYVSAYGWGMDGDEELEGEFVNVKSNRNNVMDIFIAVFYLHSNFV